MMKEKGFTLVEIAIVMIIVGLLVGGVFSGIRLMQTSQIMRTSQDLKSIESAGATFRDTYRRLPGDLRDPSVRLPDCTTAPCAVSGDGNRSIGIENAGGTVAITPTSEEFVFWHHLNATGLVQLDISNTDDMNFGVGQPSAPIGGGYRMMGRFTGLINAVNFISQHYLRVANNPSLATAAATVDQHRPFACEFVRYVDTKIDNGMPGTGKITAMPCYAIAGNHLSDYGNPTNNTGFQYYLGW
jgi:prepilin-type N-terminal cleavage/methylation domain-containing protein